MDPTAWPAQSRPSRLPRTRGDGPATPAHRLRLVGASPHTRGWTLRDHGDADPERGFPAHAGMDLTHTYALLHVSRLPRTRGDGPSARTRAADRTPASPHTRGWTRRHRERGHRHPGFPAHAGMDPPHSIQGYRFDRLPRTRGDGPYYLWVCTCEHEASPHTRGWTPFRPAAAHLSSGFPAHAGMDPTLHETAAGAARLPRTRGDGPVLSGVKTHERKASPHTRGWTRDEEHPDGRAPGFPAHAGMDRTGSGCRFSCGRLPRTRGDGPSKGNCQSGSPPASPHTRGWTRPVHAVPVAQPGFPAHAGMDPV